MKQLPYRQIWNRCERNRNVYAFDCDIDSYNFCVSMNTIEQGCHGECFECLDFHYPAKRGSYWPTWKKDYETFDTNMQKRIVRPIRQVINPQGAKHE